jgi:hypothetical protein
MKKQKISKTDAANILYGLWESGILSSNFTEDHSEYDEVLLDVMQKGYMDADEWYWLFR